MSADDLLLKARPYRFPAPAMVPPSVRAAGWDPPLVGWRAPAHAGEATQLHDGLSHAAAVKSFFAELALLARLGAPIDRRQQWGEMARLYWLHRVSLINWQRYETTYPLEAVR